MRLSFNVFLDCISVNMSYRCVQSLLGVGLSVQGMRSCLKIGQPAVSGLRMCSSHSKADSPTLPSSSPASKDEISSEFINRNPRNLEMMGIARKRKGWKFQNPSRHFYHRVVFEKSQRFISARVEHCSGVNVLTASTQEFALAKHLYSYSDVAAAENVGRVLAQRCREAGITCMDILEPETGAETDKFQAFMTAMNEGGIEFQESEEVIPPYEPGLDLENQYEMEDLLRRQKLASLPLKSYTQYGRTRRNHHSIRPGRNVV